MTQVRPEVPPDLGIDWWVAVLILVGGTALLAAAALALAAGLDRRTTYTRITEEIT